MFATIFSSMPRAIALNSAGDPLPPPHIELSRAERCDHLRGRIEGDRIEFDAGVAKVTLLNADIDRGVALTVGYAGVDLGEVGGSNVRRARSYERGGTAGEKCTTLEHPSALAIHHGEEIGFGARHLGLPEQLRLFGNRNAVREVRQRLPARVLIKLV